MAPKAASLTRLMTICSSKVIMDIADLFIILDLPLETQQWKRRHLFPDLRMRMETKLSSPALVSENFSGQDYKMSNKFHYQIILCKLDVLPGFQRRIRDSPQNICLNRVFGKSSAEWVAHRTHQPLSRWYQGSKYPYNGHSHRRGLDFRRSPLNKQQPIQTFTSGLFLSLDSHWLCVCVVSYSSLEWTHWVSQVK